MECNSVSSLRRKESSELTLLQVSTMLSSILTTTKSLLRSDNDDDYSDFMSEISYSGNALTENIRINKVLNQLIDLFKIYKNGSLPEEAYLHSIDAIITQAKNNSNHYFHIATLSYRR